MYVVFLNKATGDSAKMVRKHFFVLMSFLFCFIWNIGAASTCMPYYNKPFVNDGLSASEPFPLDHFSGVDDNARLLKWRPSSFAIGQFLMFGFGREDVASGRTIKKTIRVQLKGSKAEFKLPDSIVLKPGTFYYWRIVSDNGSLGLDSGRVWTFRTKDEVIKNDITFFVCSDNHYGRSDNSFLNKEIIKLMNATPGQKLPESIGGGIVHTPRGVIVNGDILDDPAGKKGLHNWKDFVADYGLNGNDGLLGFPVYEGMGNHDMEGRPDKETPIGGYTKAGIVERNRSRVGITAVSENGLHYSWDWDDLHLVQLNLFGGIDTNDVVNVSKRMHDPENALGFLKADLKKYVGKSGKKVIIFQHIGWTGGMSNWWSDEAKNRFFDAVKNYNIVALINGHSHGADFLPWKGLLTIHDGATARPESGGGDFMVVRVTKDKLIVAQRKKDGWGIMMQKDIK